MIQSRRTLAACCWLFGLIACSGCESRDESPSVPEPAKQAPAAKQVPSVAADVSPIQVGQSLPSIKLATPDGKPFDLNRSVAAKTTVLVFYRGGWCPYCNQHLSELQLIESELVELGCQVIAISPDRPAKLAASSAKHGLKYQLLSDSDMAAARALGIAFKVDDATVSKYKNEYGIDLEADSGQTHHQLPMPAAFVISRDGVIRFAHVNPDYKVRVDSADLVAAAREALQAR
jgi:peroxiredoxin